MLPGVLANSGPASQFGEQIPQLGGKSYIEAIMLGINMKRAKEENEAFVKKSWNRTAFWGVCARAKGRKARKKKCMHI